MYACVNVILGIKLWVENFLDDYKKEVIIIKRGYDNVN